MYLEQEVLFNMLHDKEQEAFHLVEPVMYFFQGLSFIGLGIIALVAFLVFMIIRMAQKEKYEPEKRGNRYEETPPKKDGSNTPE